MVIVIFSLVSSAEMSQDNTDSGPVTRKHKASEKSSFLTFMLSHVSSCIDVPYQKRLVEGSVTNNSLFNVKTCFYNRNNHPNMLDYMLN